MVGKAGRGGCDREGEEGGKRGRRVAVGSRNATSQVCEDPDLVGCVTI